MLYGPNEQVSTAIKEGMEGQGNSFKSCTMVDQAVDQRVFLSKEQHFDKCIEIHHTRGRVQQHSAASSLDIESSFWL